MSSTIQNTSNKHNNPTSVNRSSQKHEEDDKNNDGLKDDEKVIIKQTLCRIGQVFVYRVPPMKTSVGHRAEDWNLAKPAATCSMQILQQDNTLLIQLLRNVESSPTSTTETFLFAQAKLVFDISCGGTTCSTSTGKEQQQQQQKPIEYWVEPVVDSSRYFVIRCEDERTKRQAFVGIGFRERDESMNFKMSIEDFWRSMDREKKALHMQHQHIATSMNDQVEKEQHTEPSELISKLSLKEGEKIHINLKTSSKRSERRSHSSNTTNNTSETMKTPPLLRKPPPPADENIGTVSATRDNDAKLQSTVECNVEDEDEDWGDFEGV